MLKRLGVSTLWLAAVQALSWLTCFVVVNYVFGRDFRFEWAIYGLGILLPFLWGLGGYWLKYRPLGRWQTGCFLIVWTVLLAALCVWGDSGGPSVLWLILYPQMMARLAWFYPLFDGPKSAYVLFTLRPLAAAGTHVLMMTGFAAGLWLRGRKLNKT
jgi:hypothetical protein